MTKATYFLTNCTIAFGWVFHRLCKIFCLFNVVCESLSSIFYAPLLFRTIRFFPVGILLASKWTTYFHKIFAMKTVFSTF